jgi:hypothetical protein
MQTYRRRDGKPPCILGLGGELCTSCSSQLTGGSIGPITRELGNLAFPCDDLDVAVGDALVYVLETWYIFKIKMRYNLGICDKRL